MYLDLPALDESSSGSNPFASEDTINGPLLESMLRSEAFQHIYMNLSTRETKPLLRPLRDQPRNPNRRTHREVVNPDLSRLHALLAPDFGEEEVDRQQRGYLREVVYSSENFQGRNDWAPLTDEGKVDWTLVDAIGAVMSKQSREDLETPS